MPKSATTTRRPRTPVAVPIPRNIVILPDGSENEVLCEVWGFLRDPVTCVECGTRTFSPAWRDARAICGACLYAPHWAAVRAAERRALICDTK